MTATDKVAITGLGMVTPLGLDTQTTWQNLLAGRSGISELTHFDASALPTRIAAQVRDFSLSDYAIPKNISRYTVPYTRFALAAAAQALADANIRPSAADAERWGLVVGAGMIGNEFQEYWQPLADTFATDREMQTQAIMDAQHRHLFPPREFIRSQANSGLALLAQTHNIRGYSSVVHTACASGGQAIGLALQALRRGDADKILVGGYDSMINPFGVSAFCLLGALSTYNDTPTSASRPFDLSRNGFVLGEGAAFLVLEKWQAAKARKATIYAELAGEGNTLSSYRITDSPPDGQGAAQAITAALADGQQFYDEIDYINAHGTSTKMNDLSETNAIKKALHEHAAQVAVSSTKSQTGHLIAAAGALEVALAAKTIAHGHIPMTANLSQADPDCDLDYVANEPRRMPVRAALSNSFGFGGSNSCILLREPCYAEATWARRGA